MILPSIKASESDIQKVCKCDIVKGMEIKERENKAPCGCHLTFAPGNSGIGGLAIY